MRRWSSNAKHAVQRYVLEFKAAQKRKRLSWRSRAQGRPAAGGLFTGHRGARELLRVMSTEKQKRGSHRMSDCQQLAAHAKGEPEQEDPLTESALSGSSRPRRRALVRFGDFRSSLLCFLGQSQFLEARHVFANINGIFCLFLQDHLAMRDRKALSVRFGSAMKFPIVTHLMVSGLDMRLGTVSRPH